jgi:hypothetical protein
MVSLKQSQNVVEFPIASTIEIFMIVEIHICIENIHFATPGL